MNHINATVIKVEQFENISAVIFAGLETHIHMTALELSDKFQEGLKVLIGVKATNISLSKKVQSQISISNQLEGIVEEVHYGTILCSVKLRVKDTLIESIITLQSATRLDIKVNDAIVALIKSTDISLLQIL